jgi:putative two-component system response regulator
MSPDTRSAGKKDDAKTPAASAGGPKKLLWIEDDSLISTILSEKFISSKFNLVHTTNGEEALKILEGIIIPDVILIDLVLPGMSGFEVLEKIRGDDRLKAVPIVVLSNLSSKGDIEKAYKLGAQKFILKAVTSLDQIVQEVRELLG